MKSKASQRYDGFVAHSDGTVTDPSGRRSSLNHDRKWYARVGQYYVHRIVADAFHGPCPVGHEVNHKNGVKGDNRPENLEYVTRQENLKHAYAAGLNTGRAGHGVPQSVVDAIVNEPRRPGVVPFLAEKFGLSPHTINDFRTGRVPKGAA